MSEAQKIDDVTYRLWDVVERSGGGYGASAPLRPAHDGKAGARVGSGFRGQSRRGRRIRGAVGCHRAAREVRAEREMMATVLCRQGGFQGRSGGAPALQRPARGSDAQRPDHGSQPWCNRCC